MNARPDKTSIEKAEPVDTPVALNEAADETDTVAAASGRPAGEGEDTTTNEDASAAPPRKRRPLRLALMIALPLALVAAGSYYWVTGGRYIETEDAYVQQDRVTVMPQVSGQIAEVAVKENQSVKAGDLLFAIDDAVYRNAVESDKARLEAARLDVAKLKAAYSQAIAKRQTASDALDLAQTTYDRQNALVKRGVVSDATLDDARLSLQQAQGTLSSAEQDVLAAKAALAGNPDIPTDQHPEVMEALAALHSAELDLDHTRVTAPEAGIVSQTDQLQIGQYVTPQSAVVALVETSTSWVEANYKETELTDMHPGQPVDVVLDTYPDRPFHAHVGSIGAGTGSEFALLPAQNATGNWVKVVQRVPVRIDLDHNGDLPPMRAGMSASVTVDTGHSRGVPEFLEPAVASLGLQDWLPGLQTAEAAETGRTLAVSDANAQQATGDDGRPQQR
ncbi:MAG: HlyD family secretion protein [Fulvimarina manganoxydans]|uniref:HlyD family secretion protein n=1 Tax=Fulvimarina manganoxydans TaxID=937218 RepID=UPI0023562B82|nr:HlyD family secretion protein [Fulvimarina manganoxydans]MCK5932110.1 HlyD family secretion protein [Fulvimarina manganoxydans]